MSGPLTNTGGSSNGCSNFDMDHYKKDPLHEVPPEVLKEINSLQTSDAYLAKQLKNPETGKTFSMFHTIRGNEETWFASGLIFDGYRKEPGSESHFTIRTKKDENGRRKVVGQEFMTRSDGRTIEEDGAGNVIQDERATPYGAMTVTMDGIEKEDGSTHYPMEGNDMKGTYTLSGNNTIGFLEDGKLGVTATWKQEGDTAVTDTYHRCKEHPGASEKCCDEAVFEVYSDPEGYNDGIDDGSEDSACDPAAMTDWYVQFRELP